jgi:hypothetical protein
MDQFDSEEFDNEGDIQYFEISDIRRNIIAIKLVPLLLQAVYDCEMAKTPP